MANRRVQNIFELWLDSPTYQGNALGKFLQRHVLSLTSRTDQINLEFMKWNKFLICILFGVMHYSLCILFDCANLKNCAVKRCRKLLLYRMDLVWYIRTRFFKSNILLRLSFNPKYTFAIAESTRFECVGLSIHPTHFEQATRFQNRLHYRQRRKLFKI
jgi:hypothetical protein